ncbi:MAG: hypothetical protein ACOX52_17595 [Verrucomicrobiota bacterium]
MNSVPSVAKAPEKATPPGNPIKRPFDTDSDTDPDPDLASPSSFSDDRW